MRQSLFDKLKQVDHLRAGRSKVRSIVTDPLRHALAWASSHPSSLALLAVLAIMVLFTVRPDLDLDASRGFWTDGFRLTDDPFLLAMRELNRALPAVLLSGIVSLFIAIPLIVDVPWLIRPHKAAFVLAFYALAPGALVQTLKSLFGRARPRHITDFGGDLFFTPVFSLDGACFRNCSFPSGESASAIALLAFVVFLPRRFRPIGVAILVPFIVLFSVNRVAMGAHFLSDVVIAWPLMLAVMFPTFRLFTRFGDAIDAAVMRKGRLAHRPFKG